MTFVLSGEYSFLLERVNVFSLEIEFDFLFVRCLSFFFLERFFINFDNFLLRRCFFALERVGFFLRVFNMINL